MVRFKDNIGEARDGFDLGKGCISIQRQSGGGYFTCIPISPFTYRKKNPTKAAAIISHNGDGWTIFTLISDWGEGYKVFISDDEIDLISKSKKSLFDNGLLPEKSC